MQKRTLILSLIFIISLSIYLRILPAQLPFTYFQARLLLEDGILKEIRDNIQREYPNLSENLREKLIYNSFMQRIRQKDFSLSLRKKVRELKDKFQDEDGINYLQEIDNYRWLRYIKNLLKTGNIGDRVIKGRQYDDFSLAPRGAFVSPHRGCIWVGFLFHKIISFFKKDIPLTLTMSITPLILAIPISLLSFFISYRFGGILSGIISSLNLSLSPIFLQRSSFGWFDTDVYNVLFPLLILWFYLYLEKKELSIF